MSRRSPTALMTPKSTTAHHHGDSHSDLVREYMTAASSGNLRRDRRKRPRLAIPYVFKLTPIDDHDNLLEEHSTSVVGRDLSLNGISFSFDDEPNFNRALISLDHPAVGRFAVVAKLVWSKKTLIGLFETGSQLIGTLDGHTVRGDGESI